MKIIYKLAILGLAFMGFQAHGFSGGTGSVGNPYLVSTKAELNDIRNYPKSHFALANDIVFEVADFDSGGAFYNSGAGWVPIASHRGSLHGRGFTIQNLVVRGGDKSGLFGEFLGTSIDSLGLVNVDVSGHQYVGGIAGYNESASISQSYVTGKISATFFYSGAILGMNKYGAVNNCYSTAQVTSTTNYAGGLVGMNNSTVQNSFTAGLVSGYHTSTGAIVGYNYGSLNTSVWSPEFAQLTKGVGLSSGPEGMTSLSVGKMLIDTNYSGWDFDSTWMIRSDSTLPALRALDNAPFALPDTLVSSPDKFVGNDFDYETYQANLIWKTLRIESKSNGASLNSYVEASDQDTLSVYYQVGEYRSAQGDTLWGGITLSTVLVSVPNLNAGLDTSISPNSHWAKHLSRLATDAGNDSITYEILTQSLSGTASLSNDSLIYTPQADYLGNDSLQIRSTDGYFSDTCWIRITVKNFPPVLSAVTTGIEVVEEDSVTLSMSNVTVFDPEGDSMSLLIFSGSNYSLSGLTIIPALNFNGLLNVPVAVSDGADTSLVDTMQILVTSVNDAPVIVSVLDGLSMLDTDSLEIVLEYLTTHDADGDSLTLIVYPGSGYEHYGNRVIPNVGYAGGLEIQVAVTDGMDTSKTEFLKVNVIDGSVVANHFVQHDRRKFQNLRLSSGTLFVEYELINSAQVSLQLINVLGQNSKVLFLGNQSKGLHTHSLSLQSVSGGQYMLVQIVNGKYFAQQLIQIR